MIATWRLGRIAGIGIGLHWSVLVLLGLLMWTLATAIFPDTNPGLGDGVYFTMAVVAALAFFASILLHELGHAVQARRDGMEIDGITLWLFGGVARFAGMFPSPGAEFRIAVAGPLVSLGLGAGFVGVAFLPGLPEPVNAVCAWLGFINLLLLAFNLLPALPLDGGRMLRAGLWRWKGDLAARPGWPPRAGAPSALIVGSGSPGCHRPGSVQRGLARRDRLVPAAGPRPPSRRGSSCGPTRSPACRVGDLMACGTR